VSILIVGIVGCRGESDGKMGSRIAAAPTSQIVQFMDAKETRQLLYWCAYTVIVPVGFIAALWAIAWLVKSPNGSFEQIFGTGDLLPLGALLLLSVSADIRSEDEGKAGVWMAIHEVLFVILAIGAIMVYGPLKNKALELMKSGAPDSIQLLRA